MPPLMLVSGLVLAIPLSFDLLATRSSPTYLPLWRPLPFLLMGGAVARFNGRRSSHGRAALSAGSLAVLVVQLGVFAEQLADIEAVADETPAAELWLRYEGPSEPRTDLPLTRCAERTVRRRGMGGRCCVSIGSGRMGNC